MRFEKQERVGVAEYIEMITGKTAVLLSLCAELGALVAGQDDKTIAHYAQFGLDAGLAFQVIDDILGIWGDETLIGKSASTDISTKKKTLPVLYGLENSSELRQHYTQDAANELFVPQAVERLNQTGARDLATSKAAAYSQHALGNLEAAHPSGPAYTALNQLTDMILNREY
jgi:geranylgeranyl diphosphate synthase type I